METSNVKIFDWASVLVAKEFMDAVPGDGMSKKQLLQDLASLAHVDIKWDKNGYAVLFGAWERVIHSQVVLEDYLTNTRKHISFVNESLEVIPLRNENSAKEKEPKNSKTSPSALLKYYRCKYLNRQVRTHPKKRRIRYMSKVKHTDWKIDETDKLSENEVYVNITLTRPVKKCSEIVSVANSIAIPLDSTAKTGYSGMPEDIACSRKSALLESHNVEHSHNKERSATEIEAAIVTRQKQVRKNYEELAPFKYFCPLCSFKTKRESHFRHHEELHKQASELFFCDKCDFSTIRKGYLYRHKMTHSNIKYYCNLCHYFTDQTRLLLKHKRLKHEKSKKQLSNKTLSCAECEYTTTRRHLMQRHVRIHDSVAEVGQCKFQCSQCSYRASRKEHFIRHVNNVHKNRRPFLCDNCGKAFKRADALKQHSVVHASMDQSAKCMVCDRVCRSQAQLNQHLAVHSNIRSFLCEICGAAFKTRAVQRTHVLTIHKNPKAYPCTQCSRKFNTKYALRRHTKQHSQEDGEEQEECLNILSSEPATVATVQLNSDLPQSGTFIIQEPLYAVGIGDSQPLAVQLISFVT